MKVLEIINERQEKYLMQKQQTPCDNDLCQHGYDSAWWALQDLKEIIEQNNITEVR